MRTTTLLASLLLLTGSGAGCHDSAAGTGEPATPGPRALSEGRIWLPPSSLRYVKVDEAGADGGSAAIRAPARVAFVDNAVAEIGASVGGRVARVHVQIGDSVKAGDALVTLDSPDAAAARAALESASAAHQLAADAAARERAMLEQGIGIERDRIAADSRLREAEVEVARARAAVAYLGPGSGQTVVIRAPIAGTVLHRNATAGAYAEPGGEPLVQIGDPAALRITADVFERDLSLVRAGAVAEVELSSLNATLTGRVAAVGSVVAGTARTAPVYIEFEGAEGFQLRPGMFGRVTIKAEELAGLTVPARAVLIKDGRRHVVFVQEHESTFATREVTVGHSVGGRVQILTGLNLREPVVVEGALLLDGLAEQLL